MAGPRGMRVCLAALALALTPARAEVFKFDSELVPDARTLVAKYMFYVYAHSDSPDKSKGHPYVQFSDFELEHVDHGTDTSKHLAPGSVQVALLPWKDFWTLIDQNHFCSSHEDVQAGRAAAPEQILFSGLNGTNENNTQEVHVHTISGADGELTAAPAKKNAGRQALKTTGVYLLVISNCGGANEVTISGNIFVRNAYGFLPGNEYGKQTVYAITAAIYLSMAIMWMGVCLRHQEDLFYIHYILGGVISLGLLEVMFWYLHLHLLNADGSGFSFVLNTAMLLSGMKTVGTLMMVLVAALGKGVSVPQLEGNMLTRIWGLGTLYVVLDFTRMYTMELRHRFSLSLQFIVIAHAPALVICALMVVWIFMGISGLKKSLREQGQAIKLATYERFTCLLVLMVLVSIAAVAMQLYDQPGRGSEWWMYHWVSSDVVPGTAGIVFYLCMMQIWMPEEGGKLKAESQQVFSAEQDRDDPLDDAEEKMTGFGNTEEPASGGVKSWLGIDGGAESTKVEVAETRPSPDTIGAKAVDEV